jgi:hypothetical protein
MTPKAFPAFRSNFPSNDNFESTRINSNQLESTANWTQALPSSLIISPTVDSDAHAATVKRDNDPVRTARDFRTALEGPFCGVFSDVIFAVTDWSPERSDLGSFRDGFASAEQAVSC